MNTRALPLLLSVTLATLVLAGCGGANKLPTGAASVIAANGARAREAADPMAFEAAAKEALGMIATSPAYKNARLVSIEAHGLDQNGKMVPLLGSYWVFKFWTNRVDEEGTVAQEVTRADVVLHIEGPKEIVDDGESKIIALERVLDPAKLAAPTKIVPFAIALGLKVNAAGPSFNHYDVVYNSFYANPSAAQTDVADVVSYYQRDAYDSGLHIPARPELLPATPPAPAPAPAPAKAPTGVTKMTAQELVVLNNRSKAQRQHVTQR